MPTALLCDLEPGPEACTPVAFVLKPVMAYTRRIVRYEVSCSVPYGEGPEKISWSYTPPSCHDSLKSCFQKLGCEMPPMFAIPTSMNTEECRCSFPAGSLLMLEPSATLGITPELLSECIALTNAGFCLGISNYQGEAGWNVILPHLTHVRFKYSTKLSTSQRELLRSPLRKRLTFIGTGIDTETDLSEAMRDGVQLFQGSFAYHIKQLHWPDREFTQRLILFKRVCQPEELTLETLQEFLDWTSLAVRLTALLNKTAQTSQASISDPKRLFAELAPSHLKRIMQVSFIQDVTGSTSRVLIGRLVRQARFHELMRSCALSAPSETACFEGLMLGAMAAVSHLPDGTAGAAEHSATLLKQIIGTPMSCRAFYRNAAIAAAYDDGHWREAERLGLADGYPFATIHSFVQAATAWAYANTQACPL